MSKKIALKVQPRTGFDKSFQNLLTVKCGTLVPLVCDEIIPNTTVKLRAAISASLPPLASDTFMRVQLRTEAFFVPFRLLDGGYEYWQTRQKIGPRTAEFIPGMPCAFNINAFGANYWKPGSLADYLGYKYYSSADTYGPVSGRFSILPFLAYHRIYDDWYRNTLIQPPLYKPYANSPNTRGYDYIEHYPYVAHTGSVLNIGGSTVRTKLTFEDGLTLFDLRQRNFDDDLFTTCKPSPQLGTAQSVGFTVDQSGNGSFTIADLRAANSIQQYLERNNILGYRLQDYNKGQYGANLKDGVAQRALYLGSASFDVYSKGVYQSANPDSQSITTSNPFSSVGACYGSANAGGSFNLIDKFTANESGYIFVMVSLVPKVTYGSGIDPKLLRYIGGAGVDDRSDMANPMLQNIGNEPIYARQIACCPQNEYSQIYGYTDRYANFMTKYDEVHGLLRDGETLESFALQRGFSISQGDDVAINEEFLRIPSSYLDQVAAVSTTISNYGCWIDSWLDYKVVQPLARYSIPSLQNPAYEHGDTVVVSDGGSKI